jgi:hypothetical protein
LRIKGKWQLIINNGGAAVHSNCIGRKTMRLISFKNRVMTNAGALVSTWPSPPWNESIYNFRCIKLTGWVLLNECKPAPLMAVAAPGRACPANCLQGAATGGMPAGCSFLQLQAGCTGLQRTAGNGAQTRRKESPDMRNINPAYHFIGFFNERKTLVYQSCKPSCYVD